MQYDLLLAVCSKYAFKTAQKIPLNNVIFLYIYFFFYILKTMCNSVRERAFLALSYTLLHLVFKI